MTAHLHLSFFNQSSPELVKIVFAHPLCETARICERGNGVISKLSFSWSRGVKALALFFVRALLTDRAALEQTALLEGEDHSAAASLDYAIARQSGWLFEVFGADSSGAGYIRRLTKRSNPERKRPGPVGLFLNTSFLAPEAIEISIDGEKIVDRTALETLAVHLEHEWCTAPRSAPASQTSQQEPEPSDEFQKPSSSSYLSKIIAEEVERALAFCDSIAAPQSAAATLAKDTLFTKLVGKRLANLDSLDKSRKENCSFGVNSPSAIEHAAGILRNEQPLRFLVSGASAGAYMLFRYIRDHFGVPVEINHQFSHAGHILNRCLDGTIDLDHDLFSLSTGQIAPLLTSSEADEFSPLLSLPRTSFTLVGTPPRQKSMRRKIRGTVMLASAMPATSTHFFSNLIERGRVDPAQVKIKVADPRQMLDALRAHNHDEYAVLWFPYYRMSTSFDGSAVVDQAPNEVRYKENILFSHRRFAQNEARTQALQLLLRHAWLSLLESRLILETYARKMAGDKDLAQHYAEASGMSGAPFRAIAANS